MLVENTRPRQISIIIALVTIQNALSAFSQLFRREQEKQQQQQQQQNNNNNNKKTKKKKTKKKKTNKNCISSLRWFICFKILNSVTEYDKK